MWLLLLVAWQAGNPEAGTVDVSAHVDCRLVAQARDPGRQVSKESGFRTSLLPGEEAPDPIQPARPLSKDEVGKLEARKLLVLAMVHLERKELPVALKVLQKAHELDGSSVAILERLVTVCTQIEGRAAEAITYCRKALALDPDAYELWEQLGERAQALGDERTATDAFERASTLREARQARDQRYLEIQLQLADLYAQAKDAAKVAATLRRALAALESSEEPTDSRERRRHQAQKTMISVHLAEALSQASRFDEALTLLQAAQQTADGAQQGHLLFALAKAYAAKGDHAKALEELERYLKFGPKEPEPYELYGQILAKLGRTAEFLGKLDEWVKADVHNAALRVVYARHLVDARRFAEAQEQLLSEQVRSRNDALAVLAQLYVAMDEPAKLFHALVESRDRDQVAIQIRAMATNPPFVARLAEAARKEIDEGRIPLAKRFWANYLVAKSAVAASNVDLARSFYQRCIEERPELAALHLELIQVLWRHKKYPELVQVADAAAKHVPDEFDIHDFHARALEMQGKTAEAVAVIEQLIEGTPDQDRAIEAKLLLAWVRLHAEDWRAAIEVCQSVLHEFPESERAPKARYLLSNVYTLAGSLSKAQEELRRLVDSPGIADEVRASANNDLGYLWADEGRHLEEAEKMVRTALDLTQKQGQGPNAAYIDSLGWVLFKQRRFEEALRELEKATALEDGNDPVIWDHLGDVYRQLERVQEARQAWEKALSLFQEDETRKKRERGKFEQLQIKLRVLEKGTSPPPKRATQDDP